VAAHRYRAFLCYSHRDSAWADWLHHALESFPIPARLVGIETGAGVIPRKLAPVFRDRDELPSATNLGAKVSDALAQSANLVVICSPHAAQSHWVDEEVRTFQRLGRGDRIFCLIVEGEPGASRWAGREHDECIPSALTHRFDAAGNETTERLDPIAADARPGMDGRANARTKLVAGLLGVDLDDLRQRERRRRRWNVTAAIAIGFALLCLTSALAVNAVIARHAAERRQKQAEDLVGFMLGDLDDKLREVNRLDILESVADRAVKYFAALPSADMTADSLSLRARAQLKLGAVHRDQGRTDEAMESFRGALSSSDELLLREPGNPDFGIIEAESMSWIGFVDWSQGRLDDASRRFLAARDILLAARTRRPDDLDLLDRIGAVRTNVGRVYEARNQIVEAREEYAKVLETYTYLSRRQPNVSSWRAELGYAHNNLAQLAMKNGDLESATREYIADLEIKRNLYELDPANNARREDLVASEAFLGQVLLACGENAAAKLHLDAAMDGIEALLRIDPNSTDWLDKAGSYGWMHGQAARVLRDRTAAEKSDAASIARLTLLVAKDSANVGWQRKLAQAQLENAWRLFQLGQLKPAADAVEAAEGALAKAKGDGGDIATQLVDAHLALIMGDIADAKHDAAGASSRWDRAARASRSAEASKDPSAEAAWIRSRLRQGSVDGIGNAAQALANSGYRHADLIADLERFGIDVPAASPTSERIAQLAGEISAQASARQLNW